jgi:hypothetical protein
VIVNECPKINLVTMDALIKVELEHLVLSYALGTPVGIVKTQRLVHMNTLSGIKMNFESLIDLQYNYMFKRIFQNDLTIKFIKNSNRIVFFNQFYSRNDQLIL